MVNNTPAELSKTWLDKRTITKNKPLVKEKTINPQFVVLLILQDFI